jgi:acyl-[acyl-carrier-protein]-phospholipid O-acyltransferase / long-chain-fatty-acid--[acyl-carrier-protein] ligase
MSRSPLASRRFAPLLCCQFLSAVNDSFLKNAFAWLVTVGIGGRAGAMLITLAGAAVALPVLLLSGVAGELADGCDKAAVARRVRLAAIGVAGLAVVGMYGNSFELMLVALLALGVVNALFAPIVYGILPDHLRSEELPAANGMLVTLGFVAILLGTGGAGLSMRTGAAVPVLGGATLALAALGWLASRAIPQTQPAAPRLRPDFYLLRSTFRLIAGLWREKRLRRLAVVIAVFWVTAALVTALLPAAVVLGLHGTGRVVTVYSAIFAVAVGLGAALAAWLSAGRIVLLPSVIGALLIALFALDLGWELQRLIGPAATPPLAPLAFFARAGSWHIAIDLALIAIGGALLVVPSLAALEAWAAPERRGRIVAAVNLVNIVVMASGVLGAGIANGIGVPVPTLLYGVAVIAFATAQWIFATLPTNPVHDLLSIVLRAVYRLETHNLENIDKAGPGAIIALNHVSFLDAAVALSILPEEPVFAIDHRIAQRWWVKPFLMVTRAVPLDPTRPLAARTLITTVRNGDRLVIFPEGRITVTGRLMKVYDGAAMIAEKTGATIVPVRIEGLEATVFSRLTRAQVRRRLFPKVTVTVLDPVRLGVDEALKGKARRHAAGAALYQIMSDLIFRTTPTDRTLVAAIVDAAGQHGWRRIAVEDPVTGALSYRKLLLAARVLAVKLQPLAPEGGALGVMLPTANGAAATVLGVISAGRVPAMINFTAGAANILAACTAARVETIVTSRRFVEAGHFEELAARLGERLRLVYLEDVRQTVTAADRLRCLLGHREALVPRAPDDPAVILFTSGSEGTPKGVVLSHRNLLTNAAQAVARIDFGRTDKVFNVLPVFHSFGLTIGLLLPLLSGVRVFLYPSPLHYRIVPELVYASNATILFGTDTFLAGYARAAHPYDFRSLRYVLAGAEPVREATQRIWGEKFGLRILEGYGITEAAPAVALNTPMFNRSGTVGRLLPGIEARLETIPGVAEGGRLYLRGPNVMLGYLKVDQPGLLQPPQEGWHDTGDIVAIDDQGFVTIKGRARRFAKIGGEMVSLAAVERLAAELWPETACAVVVGSDPRKGERLVLVADSAAATRAAFHAHARAKGVSELMVPADFVILDRLPVLGTGKLDLVSIAGLIGQRGDRAADLELDPASDG